MVLRKLVIDYKTFDELDKKNIKKYLIKLSGYTIIGVGLHNLVKSEYMESKFKINFSKNPIGRILGLKFGIGVLIPISIIGFKDFLDITLRIGLKHYFIQ